MLPWLAQPGEATATTSAEQPDLPLAKLVRDEMLALILSGAIAPGRRINEPDLAARMQVSRVPVREALRELESSGLIASRKNFGAFVRVLQAREVAELYELRSVLDGHAGQRVSSLATVPRRRLVKRMKGQLQEMVQHAGNHDVQAYYACNLRFHWAVIEAADNQVLLSTYRGIVQMLHLSRLSNLSHDLGMQASIAEHERIVDAVAAGDAMRCQRLMAHHVTASHERLQQRLSPRA